MSKDTSPGYAELADFMSLERYPMFRKFEKLASLDLLYRQSELVHLEEDLGLIREHDNAMGGEEEEQLYNYDWKRLSTSRDRGSSSKQYEVALKIRARLRDYYDAMLQYRTIFKQPRPRSKDVELVRDWIRRRDLGGGSGFIGKDLGPYPPLGLEHPIVYDEQFEADLTIIVDQRGEDDAFTRLLTGPVLGAIDWIVQRIKQPPDTERSVSSSGNLRHYSDTHIEWAVDLFGTILASVAPVSSIVILYFVRNLSARLGVVCAFTIIFAAVVKLATRAKRVEIFAATAAFCSVQVVFISSTTPNQGGQQ